MKMARPHFAFKDQPLLALLWCMVLASLLPASTAELIVREIGKVQRFGGAVTDDAAKRPAEDTSTCGMLPGVADCDHPDLGSCGNACCTLEVPLNSAPEAAYQQLKSFLESGGDSGAFAYVPGKMPHGEHPADDIRGGGSEWKFIVQGTHTTSGKHYVDTLDFNIRSQDPSSSVLRMFSVSDVHGALGDAGQNYKSLAYALRSMGMDVDSAKILHGCGSQAADAEQLLQEVVGGGGGHSSFMARREATEGRRGSLSAATSAKDAPTSTCGLDKTPPVADCDKPDMGSCGNACCVAEVTLDAAPEDAQEMLARVLQAGGDNSSFAYVAGQDLHLPTLPFKSITQGTHSTSGRHYVDTLDFNIRVSGSFTVLRGFSISRLHGSLGDAGQGFKNLAYVFSSMGVDRSDIKELYGCGGSASS